MTCLRATLTTVGIALKTTNAKAATVTGIQGSVEVSMQILHVRTTLTVMLVSSVIKATSGHSTRPASPSSMHQVCVEVTMNARINWVV